MCVDSGCLGNLDLRYPFRARKFGPLERVCLASIRVEITDGFLSSQVPRIAIGHRETRATSGETSLPVGGKSVSRGGPESDRVIYPRHGGGHRSRTVRAPASADLT